MKFNVSATKYTGKARPAISDSTPNDIIVNLTNNLGVTLDSIGNYEGAFFTNGVTSNPEWTSFQALYSEYRVLAMEYVFVPTFGPGYNTTSIPATGLIATRHSSSVVTPSTIQTIADIPTFKPFTTSRPKKMVWKMIGVDESGFQSTVGGGVSTGGILLCTKGGTPLAAMGQSNTSYLVQFKGRN